MPIRPHPRHERRTTGVPPRATPSAVLPTTAHKQRDNRTYQDHAAHDKADDVPYALIGEVLDVVDDFCHVRVVVRVGVGGCAGFVGDVEER